MRTRPYAKLLYLLICPLCFLLGGFALDIVSSVGERLHCHKIPNWKRLYTSLIINGVCGIVTGTWCLVGCCSLRKPPWSTNGKVYYSRIGFYHLVINVCALALLISAAVIGPTLTQSGSACRQLPTFTCSDESNFFNFIAYRHGWSVAASCQIFTTTIILQYVVIILLGAWCLITVSEVLVPPRIRGTYLLARRTLQRLSPPRKEPLTESPRKELVTESPPPDRQAPDDSKKPSPNLLSILSDDHIAFSLAQHLHFVDISNFGLAFKSSRAVLFPPPDKAKRRELLRIASCVGGQKSQCWTCGTQICQDCKTTISLEPAVATWHIMHCEAYCTKCFYQQVCIQPYKEEEKVHDCNCTYRQRPTDQCAIVASPREICRDCASLQPEDAVEIRNRHEKESLKVLSRSLECAECKKDLTKLGRRWWACNICHEECTWEEHSTLREVAEV